MKKKLFCIMLLCFLITPSRATLLNSDLSLLSKAPTLDKTDPQWDLAWHAKLAEYGDADSQFFIAQVYEQGRLVPRNYKKAIEFYKRAATQNHLESCMKLGRIYRDEAWGEPDAEQSFAWYLRAAEAGYTPAQIQVSDEYTEKVKYDEALVWLEKALTDLFPGTTDFARVSPDWERLQKLQQGAQ